MSCYKTKFSQNTCIVALYYCTLLFEKEESFRTTTSNSQLEHAIQVIISVINVSVLKVLKDLLIQCGMHYKNEINLRSLLEIDHMSLNCAG